MLGSWYRGRRTAVNTYGGGGTRCHLAEEGLGRGTLAGGIAMLIYSFPRAGKDRKAECLHGREPEYIKGCHYKSDSVNLAPLPGCLEQ
jgi:hypothetical protein